MIASLQAVSLFVHIVAGSIGLLSGAASMTARKGGRVHRLAGQAFFVSMLVMTGIGAALAPFVGRGAWTTTAAGVFTFYLVATAWVTVRRRPGEVGRFEVAALVAPIGILIAAGVLATRVNGFQPFYVFAILSLIGLLGDLHMIRGGGLSPVGRLARHLWRMGVAFTIAVTSFVVGQQEFMPELVRKPQLLAIPSLLALGATLFWLIQRTWPRQRRVAAAV